MWDPRSIRIAIIEHHYRTEWEWDETLMPRSSTRLTNWAASVGGTQSDLLNSVRACLDDDLDTPGALSLIDAAAAAGVDVSASAALLGVELRTAIGPR
jgi:L-cysteine:1D-myo-inositol 2-amino-2-deoxy-alpha-D-glucopyranoside ligase